MMPDVRIFIYLQKLRTGFSFMQIILANAKIMNSKWETAVPITTEPRFKREAEAFARELATHSVEELAAILNCNHKIAAENRLRFQSFTVKDELVPAILAYNGQAYKYLKASGFNAEDFTFAQQHLFILSFLYGMLRPLDLIHPYRLEERSQLLSAHGDRLTDFWKPRLTNALITAAKADDGILLHLATEEYEHLFDWRRVCNEVNVMRPLFMVDKGIELKTVTVHAKSCRGAMARYIIRNRITSAGQLKGFTLNGYKYQSNYGDALHPHFISK